MFQPGQESQKLCNRFTTSQSNCQKCMSVRLRSCESITYFLRFLHWLEYRGGVFVLGLLHCGCTLGCRKFR